MANTLSTPELKLSANKPQLSLLSVICSASASISVLHSKNSALGLSIGTELHPYGASFPKSLKYGGVMTSGQSTTSSQSVNK